MAWRAASLAKCSGEAFAVEVFQRHTAAAAGVPRAEPALSDFAMQKTLMRASGCASSAKLPSEPITRMRRISSA